MDLDREIIKLVISMQAKAGASCVYGMHELEKIIATGCEQLGYNILTDNDVEDVPIKGCPLLKENVSAIYAFITPKE